ncbi:MAG: VCBS repeat-containing protein, partial [Bacteroidota bacterium]
MILLTLLMIWMGTSCGNETRDSDKDLIESAEQTPASFLAKSPIGFEVEDKPQISNLAVEDLNEDGLLDILVCDSKRSIVSWIRQNPDGTYTEEIISSELTAPAHIEVDDFDEDGDKDLLVADLGMLFPNNDKIGSVIILENDGNAKFKKRVIVENVARVADVRAGDLDGDGDKDLAVAQFGYDDGETRWIENLGNWE